MSKNLDCQQLLAALLKEKWATQEIDRIGLRKTLRVSMRQLLALENGDDGAFHTRGLYLRAVEQAVQTSGLQDDSEVIDCLACLYQQYAQTPRGSQISLVQQTLNKRLAIAPSDSSDKAPLRVGFFGALVVIVVLVTIVMGVSTFAE